MSTAFAQGQALWQDGFTYPDGALPTVAPSAWELGPWGSDPTGVVTAGRFASGQADNVTGNNVTIQPFSVAATPPGGAIAAVAGEGLDFTWRGVVHQGNAGQTINGYFLSSRRSPTGYTWKLVGGATSHQLVVLPTSGGVEQTSLISQAITWPASGGDIGIRVMPTGQISAWADTGTGWVQVGATATHATAGTATYPTGIIGVESRLNTGRIDAVEVRTTQTVAPPPTLGATPPTRLGRWAATFATPDAAPNTTPDAAVAIATTGISGTTASAPSAIGREAVVVTTTGTASSNGRISTTGQQAITIDATGQPSRTGAQTATGLQAITIDARGEGHITTPYEAGGQRRTGMSPLRGRIPHLRLPLRLTAGRALDVIEQDTLDDITQCVDVVRRTLPGERLLAPTVGLDDPTFTGLDLDVARRALEDAEPRARITLAKATSDDGRHETVHITVTTREG